MKKGMNFAAGLAGIILGIAALAGPAAAQAWPEPGRRITAIVPFPAGGGTDAFARLILPKMATALGVPVEIINRPGASSQLGLTQVAGAPADGYTIGFQILPTSLAYLDADRKSAYTRQSFTPIGPAFLVESVIAVHKDSPFKTLADMVAALKAKPGSVTSGTPGVMSTGHLAAIGFEQSTGTELALVNFQGGGPNVTALLGGHVNTAFFAMNEALSHLEVRGGNVRVLAVLSDKPNPYGIPTAASQGFNIPSYAPDAGIVAPAGIPAAALAALSRALKAAIDDPELKAAAEKGGNSIGFMTPEEYARHWAAAEGKYKPLIDIAKSK